MAGYKVSQFIEPFNNKPIASPDQTVGQVLESTDSSHKPVYVFDGKNYLGVISGYQTLYHNFHAPHTKKVITELKNTPTLTPDSSLHEAIRSMMDTRLYELPVVNANKKIQGVITINKILNTIFNDEVISAFLTDCIELKEPVVRRHEGTVADVFHLLRDKNVSRVVLTDSHGKVNGIVSRSDIQVAFLRPLDRQRFRGPAEDTRTTLSDDREETFREDDPIERFSQKNVSMIRDNTPKHEIIKQLINSEYNSVVIVDRVERPVGFLSTRDIVHCLATLQAEVSTPIIFEKPDSTVTEVQVEKAQQKVEQMVKKLSKIKPIEKVEIAINEQKFSNTKVAEFQTRIVISMKGQNVMVSDSSKIYIDSVQNAINIAEKKFIKNTKHTYHKAQTTV